MNISILSLRLAVCRLKADAPLPEWARLGGFFSITRTIEELSIVCPENQAPPGARIESGWSGLKVEGPLDFALIGILANLSGTLAQAGISIFAISTFDTDYILVKEKDLEKAIQALKEAGHQVHYPL